MIKFVRNTLIILLITIAYGLVMLHYGQKKFYEWDNEKQLNYLNKEPANYDIFAVHPDSIVAPIKSKKLNGMLPTQGWSEKYIDPANKKVIYDVHMSTSQIGARINHSLESNGSKHFIVAGDSQVFGMGVDDDKVLTNLLNYQFSNLNFYNMGHAAWSASSTYLFFDPKVGVKIKNFIPEPQGIMIYIMYPYLTYRDNAYPNALSFTNGLLTNYEKVGDDLILKGTFKQTNSFWLNIKKMATYYDKGAFVEDYLMPLRYMNDKNEMLRSSFNKTAFIISGMRYNYQNTYPDSLFYVLLCDPLKEDPQKLLLNELNTYELKVIDLTNEDVCRSLHPYYFVEHHLNNNGHSEMARLIQEKLIEPNSPFLGL